MGRLMWYAGVSTALAGGVVVSAFNQRANFYSACVYLAQSNLCLMIIINLILFVYGSFMYGLQRLCYGPLRPIEIEQIYEKAWFAITETCLAMTIFRDEVGAWFLVMFVALLTGKVWGWIGDGRVEVLEQQPPANPRLFHMRLSISLAMSVLYDLWLMSYTINTVIQQARPNMMVMFLFEFAILTTCSFATAFRYCISLVEAKVVKKQTQERLVERRREVREERAEIIRQREAAAAAAAAEGESSDAAQPTTPLPNEEDVDEMDIEVPGWEAKGHWVLTLDLITDFVKLGIYVTFFIILLIFYGLPIHIMRDLFLTTRSFTKRLAAFLRYRRATQDMNKRYEDATVEDIEREDTCIICREDMRPWSVTNPDAPQAGAAGGAAPAPRPATNVNERMRPKKLPCGHILHLGCLKSWLERQQVCPTCRRPVVEGAGVQGGRAPANNENANRVVNRDGGAVAERPGPGQQDGQVAPPAAPAGAPRAPIRGMRVLNLGPLRVGFGQANVNDLAQAVVPGQDGAGGGPRVYGLELGFPRRAQAQHQEPTNAPPTAGTIHEQLRRIEEQLLADIRNIQITQQELQGVQLLHDELQRLRRVRGMPGGDLLADNRSQIQIPQMPLQMEDMFAASRSTQPMQRHGARPNSTAIPAGSADLPPGVTIPEGWSLMPLERLDRPHRALPTGGVFGSGPAVNAGLAPTATTQPSVSPMTGNSNNTLRPTPTWLNPENHSQASSVDSLDMNAIHTPPSVTADQSGLNAPSTTIQSTSSSNSTARPLAQEDSSVLPNWGSSQLFSGSRTVTNSGNTNVNATSPPISANHRDVSTHAGPSAEASSSAVTQEEEDRRKEKGKAKAVTVEDTDDEDEGV